ncbi:MAG: DUF4124 domain-containing protein [Desulfobulbaceae bacterium]|nr:DUF4124 domain-containing protein [Desulfobulbaceae bacterium]
MKKLTLFLSMVFASSLVLSAQPVLSKLYRWVDDNGNIRVTDYPPPSSSSAGRNDPTPQAPVARQQVELYITSWCPYCRKAEDFFRARGIPFKSYDIEKDKEAAARKNQLDKEGGVPFAVINGFTIHGFNPEVYADALRDSENAKIP